jgi:hypothetical protein
MHGPSAFLSAWATLRIISFILGIIAVVLPPLQMPIGFGMLVSLTVGFALSGLRC